MEAVTTRGVERVFIDGASGALKAQVPSLRARQRCPEQIDLTRALALAEQVVSGTATAIVPDDDVSCAFEAQVLSGEVLLEVKLAGDGTVLEVEAADEDGTL